VQAHRQRFQRHVEPLARNQRCALHQHLAGDVLQVNVGPLGVLQLLVHLGLGQQLVGQVRGPVHGAQHLGQGLCGLQLTGNRALQLGLEHRQWRAQLVRGLGDEALLLVQRRLLLQPLAVEAAHDGFQLGGRGVFQQGGLLRAARRQGGR
jgi:hypothetical protein